VFARTLPQQAAPPRRIALIQQFEGFEFAIDRIDRQRSQPARLHQQHAIRQLIGPQHGLPDRVAQALQAPRQCLGLLQAETIERSDVQ